MGNKAVGFGSDLEAESGLLSSSFPRSSRLEGASASNGFATAWMRGRRRGDSLDGEVLAVVVLVLVLALMVVAWVLVMVSAVRCCGDDGEVLVLVLMLMVVLVLVLLLVVVVLLLLFLLFSGLLLMSHFLCVELMS